MIVGRAAETQQIIEDLCAGRTLVIVSDPGMGATSLLTECVAPEMRSRGSIVALVNEWEGRFFSTGVKETIAQAVRDQAESGFFAESETLDEMLQRIRSRTGQTVTLLLDQFEDYLRGHRGTDLSDMFDADLSHAVANRNAQFVIALHSAARQEFERLSPLIPNLLGHVLTLRALTPEAAAEAVRAEGFTADDSVTEALLSAPLVQHRGGIHPWYLSTGLKRFREAEKRVESHTLRMATLEVHGGAQRLIAEALDSEIGELSANHQELLFRWCSLLISPGGQRRTVTEAALMEHAGKLNRFAQSLIPKLLEMELLRNVELQGAIRCEIANECQAPILQDWRSRRETALIARRKAQFRARSMWVAAGAIVAVYLVWLLMDVKR